MKRSGVSGTIELCTGLERAGRLVALLQVSLVPLCVSSLHQSPYILPKQALGVWIALAVLLPLLIARAVLRRERFLDNPKFDIPALVLGAWMLVSSLFSANLYDSLDLILLYAAAWVTWKAGAVFFDTERSRVMAIGVLVASGIVACLTVWYQAANGNTLPHGLFGNKNFQSQWLLLPTACCLPLALHQLTGIERDRRWRIAAVALLIFLIATLIRLQSMGALLGLILAGFTVSFAFQWRNRWRLVLTRTQGLLLIICLVLLAAGVGIRLFSSGPQLREKAEQVLAEDSVRVRLEIWKGSLSLIRDHLWHGTGPGNFYQVYPLYRREAEMTVFGKATTVRHAHNCYIEWTAELGVLGLVFLLWLVHSLTSSTVDYLTEAEGFGWRLAVGILAALVATDGQSFFSSNIYQAAPVLGLGLLVGLLEATLREQKHALQAAEPDAAHQTAKPLSSQRLIAALGGAMALSLAATLLLGGPLFRASVADILVRSAIHDKNAGDWNAAAQQFEQASKVDSRNFDASLYRTILALEQGRPRTSLKFADRALAIQSQNFTVHYYRGLAQEKAGDSEEAKKSYQQALKLMPFYKPAKDGLERLGEKG